MCKGFFDVKKNCKTESGKKWRNSHSFLAYTHQMKNILLLVIVASLCASCSDNAEKNQTSQDKHALLENKKDALTTSYKAPSFYKRYEGIIANQPVVVYLQKTNNTYNGNYFYKKIGMTISLIGTVNSTDSLSLEEMDRTAYYNGVDVSPNWICVFSGDSIKGKWMSGNGKKVYDIDLKENYPEGSYAFELKHFSDSIVAFPGMEKSPVARSSYGFPLMMGENNDAEWFNSEIKTTLNVAGNKSIAEGIKKENDSFFAEFKSEIQDLKKDLGEDDYPETWNYEESLIDNIHYNENGIVVMESMVYSYAGGAHGNYGSTFYNYDVQQKKILKLDDVIHIDSVSLQKVLEQSFRKDYNLPSPKPLTDILFDPFLATTDNFYIGEKGLGFLYNPYEVASYAAGQIEVFVPYTALADYLTADFKKRMKL